MAERFSARLLAGLKPKSSPYDVWAVEPKGLLIRVHPSGRASYYLQYARGKRLKLGDVGVLTLEGAKFKSRELLNKAQEPEAILAPQNLRLREFLSKSFKTYLAGKAKRNPERTIREIQTSFPNFLERNIHSIRLEEIEEFVAENLRKGKKLSTINREINNLRTLFRAAFERKVIHKNIFTGWGLGKIPDSGKTRYLSEDEEKRLREALLKRDKYLKDRRENYNKWLSERGMPSVSKSGEYFDYVTPMILVALKTGLRYGELAKLAWPNIDFRAKSLTVTGETSKTTNTRHVPLNPEILEVLKVWRKQTSSELVFSGKNGNSIGSIKTAFKKVLEEACIKDFRFHDLRHSFASHLAQKGVPLYSIQKLTGHKTLQMVQRYAHLSEQNLRDAVGLL